MSRWNIQIPHRSRDESLIDTASNCRHLERDDCAVSRRIVLDAATSGMRTAGDLLDHLAALEPAERRRLLDRGRIDNGLPPTSDVEAVERSVVATEAGSVVAAGYAGLLLCHGKTAAGLRCNAIPMTDYGVPAQLNVRRWYCAEHIGQAVPGDMDPPPPPWRYSESGAIVPNDPAGEARDAAAAESRRRQLAARLADAQADAAAHRAHQDAAAEAHRRELPLHLRELV